MRKVKFCFSGKLCRVFVFAFLLFISPKVLFAQLGSDGIVTVTATNTRINEYTSLTADAIAGATIINVANSVMNDSIRFGALPGGTLLPGDLLLIIQMQGATINGSLNGSTALPDDSTWGAVTNYNNCGLWELVEVRQVISSTQIRLDCALKNSYSAAGKTQLVRIPRITTLTILNSAELTCDSWNGTTGGILAIETQNDIIINSGGKIDATGKGFRGGKLLENVSASGITNIGSTLDSYGAEKGESIAGYQADYDSKGGRYGKGAPANGGGGGNAFNAGGGGGANAGALNAWNGYGNPDLSGSYINAWNQEFAGRASITSSGGGRGGYSYSANNQDALSVPASNVAWGGDNRRAQGGFGGRPLDYTTSKFFLGGGGGAGDQDNMEGGEGGNGGGLIYLLSYGNISGAGQVISNGADGENSSGTPAVSGYAGRDGAGGGGGGGTIVLNAVGNISGISAIASGGNGGNQVISKGGSFVGAVNEAEGPGGGGGGGYIAVSGGSITQIANGGINGTTNSDALTEFPPNGATKGGSGIIGQSITNFNLIIQNDTICSGESATLTATLTGNSPIGTVINWYNVGSGGGPIFTGATYTTPILTAPPTSRFYFVGTCPSSYRATVRVTVVPPFAVNAGNDTTKCASANIQLSATGANSYSWSPITGLSNPNIANPICSVTATTTYIVTGTINGCTDTDTITVNVTSGLTPDISIVASQNNVCSGTSITFTATPTNGGATPSYQWRVNGGNVGLNQNSFTSSTLNNGDVVTCIMTSSLTGCLTTLSDTSNTIVMNVSAPASASVSIVVSANPVCAGDNIAFTATPANGGSSPSYQWKVNGGNVGLNQNTFITNTLNNGDVVACEMTSNAVCVSPLLSISNQITITINSAVVPSVSISATQTTICGGTSVTFTATPTNGGVSPSYQWKINGNNAGTNQSTFTTSSLSNNDVITCELASNANCVNPVTATSNTIIITVTSSVVPSVSISATQTTICAGTSVTFTATPNNGGVSPTFQWKVNGNNVGTNASSFSTSLLNDGDLITCVITSNANCVLPDTALSNSITIDVTTALAPSVSITASQTTTCPGGSVFFTATPVYGGSSPSYQWKVNGNNVGTNQNTFATTTLNNGDVVTCELTSNANCVNPATVLSNGITITVTSVVVPDVSITASRNSVCAGENVIFTATPNNGGTSPAYQWKVNGNNVGGNQNSFASATLADGDEIICEMTSNAGCVNPATVMSNSIIISVTPSVVPSVSISASQTNVCSGTNITFTASPVNGGSSPNYQWKVNGSNVGTNSSTFITQSLNNNDVITCEMTSSANCAVPTLVVSNAIMISVTSNVIPSVIIVASQTNICTGDLVTFTATLTNGGSSPVYQWVVNGINVGLNQNTYSSSALNNGDVVTCEVTSNAVCANPLTALSNSVSITVSTSAIPTITISASQTIICSGATVTFIANVGNAGSNPSFQWKVNGNNAGTNADTFSISSLSNGSEVKCILTSNNPCSSVPAVESDSIVISVSTSFNPSVTINASQTTVCDGVAASFKAVPQNTGPNPQFLWFINGVSTNDADDTYSSTTLNDGDEVVVRVTSTVACASPQVVYDTVVITIIPSPIADAGQDVLICKSDSMQLNGSGGVSYSWAPSRGLNNPQIFNPYAKPDTTTNYILTVTGQNGCVDKDTLTVVVDTCNSVNDFVLSVFQIYPNPTYDIINLDFFYSSFQNINIEMYDVNGKEIHDFGEIKFISNRKLAINTNVLSAGVYQLRIIGQNRIFISKFIKL